MRDISNRQEKLLNGIEKERENEGERENQREKENDGERE